nr:EOG090X0CJ3 [Macrothrix elegans]
MSGDHRTVIKGSPSQYVKLNVGGSLHYTTIGTLTKHDTMLRAMFSGRMEVLTDSEVNACENALKRKERERDVEPACRVPLITSAREEQMLISTSAKPVVKLLINRHNNKYSYTSASDDNLLKNLELFDKLSLRFSGRVLFLKDVIGSQEICLWSFFGHGKKVAEDEPQKEDPAAVSNTQGGPSMLSWAFYQRYFDVDTPQVKERVIWSFVPRPSKDTLTNYIRPSPDLYGPFWVCVTLVFCIAIMGNISDYMHTGGEGQHWRYDFRKVSISASTIFSYSLLVPLFLWVFLWWRRKEGEQAPLRLMEIICLYGYSLAIYIPISVLWTIPFAFIQWTLVLVGATLSGSVLVLSLWPPLSSNQRGIAVAVLAVLLSLHFLLAAGLQLYFFRYSRDSLPNATISGAITGGDPVHIEATSIDKVTELKPLNLVWNPDNFTTADGKPEVKTSNIAVSLPVTPVLQYVKPKADPSTGSSTSKNVEVDPKSKIIKQTTVAQETTDVTTPNNSSKEEEASERTIRKNQV